MSVKNEYMRQYMREYRKNNKDKVKEIQERYWEKKTKMLMDKLETLKDGESVAFYLDDLETEIQEDLN